MVERHFLRFPELHHLHGFSHGLRKEVLSTNFSSYSAEVVLTTARELTSSCTELSFLGLRALHLAVFGLLILVPVTFCLSLPCPRCIYTLRLRT